MKATAAVAGTAIRHASAWSLAWALAAAHLILPRDLEARDRRGIHLGVIPVSNFSSDAGYTIGVLAQRFDYGEGIEPAPGARPFQSLITLQTTYATLGPRDAWLSYEAFLDRSLDPLGWRVAFDAYAMDSEYQRYYGLGPETEREASLESEGFYYYDRRTVLASGAIRKRVPSLAGVDLQLSATQVATRSDPGNRPSSQYEQDFGARAISQTYTQVAIKGLWERRNSEFIPTRGSYLMASLGGAPAAGWSRLDLDARRYFEILPGRSLWLASQIRYTGTSRDTPLQEKARLGSLGTFRGVALNRYLSNHSASLRNELRSIWLSGSPFGFPLKIGSGVFIDAGRIADKASLLSQSPTRIAWGFALFGSYFTDDFLGSADFGFSQGERSMYLRLGHAF
jgi:hypothetical protein